MTRGGGIVGKWDTGREMAGKRDTGRGMAGQGQGWRTLEYILFGGCHFALLAVILGYSNFRVCYSLSQILTVKIFIRLKVMSRSPVYTGNRDISYSLRDTQIISSKSEVFFPEVKYAFSIALVRYHFGIELAFEMDLAISTTPTRLFCLSCPCFLSSSQYSPDWGSTGGGKYFNVFFK